MALQNADELAQVLDRADHLGPVFARHAYGMRAWVDLFSAHVGGLADPADKTLLAALIATNARHMMLFRERASANGTDPDAYTCPDEGEVIYDRIPQLAGPDELVGYALGSLDHFAELLAVYRGAAGGDDAAAIDTVRADVDDARAQLRARAGAGAQALAAEAHERYRVRELAEVPRYAHAA
ncbi:MAG: hypothetical protein QOH72_1734 [Solirubrobacteraceae bacterium]|jgi:hypothetical protein|nr:hypothetical protein [Solirubrobacteraceae bacterium]